MTPDSDLLRRAMRTWTTGVAILMAAHAGETYGMTINSFTSLSLEPPLISVALQNSTHIYSLVTQSRVFGVSILSAAQRELAEDFAGGMGQRPGGNIRTSSGAVPDGQGDGFCRVFFLGENRPRDGMDTKNNAHRDSQKKGDFFGSHVRYLLE